MSNLLPLKIGNSIQQKHFEHVLHKSNISPLLSNSNTANIMKYTSVSNIATEIASTKTIKEKKKSNSIDQFNLSFSDDDLSNFQPKDKILAFGNTFPK